MDRLFNGSVAARSGCRSFSVASVPDRHFVRLAREGRVVGRRPIYPRASRSARRTRSGCDRTR